jgi:cephalosporin-C deacetylase-like acetyl esterase
VWALVCLGAGLAGVGWGRAFDLRAQATSPSAADASDPRGQLVAYLNGIARGHLAERAKAIAGVRTRADAERRQVEVRAKLLSLIGGLPQRASAQGVRPHSRSQQNGFTLESLTYESAPGMWVTANVYVPPGKGPFAAVLLAPGHGVRGKTELWTWGVNLARHGVLALAYDPIGQGERLQYFDEVKKSSEVGNPTGEHGEANVPPMLIGETIARYMVNDAIRSLDYLTSRPDVDASRLGAFGCSGGGVTTAYLAALDDRVRAAASACYISSFDKLLVSATGVQEAEQSLPGFLAANLDFADWVEVVAPRAYAIVSTTEDMFPFAGARETFEEASRFYGLFGARDRLQWITGPGAHGNLGPIAAPIVEFFLTRLARDGQTPAKASMIEERLEDFDVIQSTPSGQVSTSYRSETVASLNLKRAVPLVAPMPSVSTPVESNLLRTRLRSTIRTLTGAQARPGAPAMQVDVLTNDAMEYYRVESLALRGDEGGSVTGALLTPRASVISAPGRGSNAASSKRPIVIVLDDRPLSMLLGADSTPDRLARGGALVLVLNPRPTPVGTESIKSPYLGPFNLLSLRAFLVGKTILGLRIDDTIRAIDWLVRRPDADNRRVSLYGRGASAMVALHVGVLDDRVSDLDLENLLGSYRSVVEELLHKDVSEVVVPGVLRHYDVDALLLAMRPRTVRVVSWRTAGGDIRP